MADKPSGIDQASLHVIAFEPRVLPQQIVDGISSRQPSPTLTRSRAVPLCPRRVGWSHVPRFVAVQFLQSASRVREQMAGIRVVRFGTGPADGGCDDGNIPVGLSETRVDRIERVK